MINQLLCFFGRHDWNSWEHDLSYIEQYDAVVRSCQRCRTQQRSNPHFPYWEYPPHRQLKGKKRA